MALQLYHYEPTANSMKPLLYLAENAIEYESHYIDLHKPLEERRRKWRTAATESFTEEALADSRRQVWVSIDQMEERLRQAACLACDEYSLTDVNTCSMVAGTARLIPEAMEGNPKSVAWFERMGARRAVKAALATSRQPMAAAQSTAKDA